VRVAAPRATRKGALLRRGVPLTVTCGEPGTVGAVLMYRRRAIARDSGRLAAPGTLRLMIKPARARLAEFPRRSLRLTVTTATGAGQAPQVVTRTVVVRR
jgi:hypothetical protein